MSCFARHILIVSISGIFIKFLQKTQYNIFNVLISGIFLKFTHPQQYIFSKQFNVSLFYFVALRQNKIASIT